MIDLDLDIVKGKQPEFKLNGEEIRLRNITIAEHFNNEFLLQELDRTPLNTKKNVEKASKIMVEYLVGILDISEEVASDISMDQLKMIRKYMDRKDMYDQGFNDKDIDELEKKALKKQMAQLI